MNLIMNKTRNFLKAVNVDKLTFIYMNNRTLDRSHEMKKKLQFAGIDVDEEALCDMKNMLLQEKIAIFSNEAFSSKRPASQKMTGDAVRTRIEI